MTKTRPLPTALRLTCATGSAAARNTTIRVPAECAAGIARGQADLDFA